MNKFIFSFILLATFFISCGKDSGTNDPNNPNGNGGEQPTLTLSLTELTFKSAGEEKTFTITSNSNWTIRTQVHGVKLIQYKAIAIPQ